MKTKQFSSVKKIAGAGEDVWLELKVLLSGRLRLSHPTQVGVIAKFHYQTGFHQ